MKQPRYWIHETWTLEWIHLSKHFLKWNELNIQSTLAVHRNGSGSPTTWASMWVTNWTSHFFHGPCFPLRKWQVQSVVQSECWIDVFAKMNGLSLSFQEKHPAMSITNGDIQTFKQKLEFWKTYLLSWKRVFGSDLWEFNRQLFNIEVHQHLGELCSWASCCLQWQIWSSRTILDLPLGAGLQIPYCSDPRNDHMINFVISRYIHSDMTNIAKYTLPLSRYGDSHP